MSAAREHVRDERSGKIAIYLPNAEGGGAERSMINLVRALAARGIAVDLVLAKVAGPYLTLIPERVRVVDLGNRRILASLLPLVRYLRRERPVVLLSALEPASIVALWARRLARVQTKIVVSVQTTVSRNLRNAPFAKDRRAMPHLLRWFLPQADAIVANSHGVATDLARTIGLPSSRIEVIYNPVPPDLAEQAARPVDHPWFAEDAPPVILGVGRLTRPKDFPTLLRALQIVRRRHPARLLILGEGEDRAQLEALVRDLDLDNAVAMPGFVDNPFAYMARAAVFVLSSAWEGLPSVLFEAMLVGVPVVSTDCESGPREILEGGRWGKLVPVGEVPALASAILAVLEGESSEVLTEEARHRFTTEHFAERYLEIFRR